MPSATRQEAAADCRRRCRGAPRPAAIGRLQRIAPEGVLDVGQQQLLMLLLVLQAELDQLGQLGIAVTAEQLADGVVDIAPVGAAPASSDGRESRPRCGRACIGPTDW